MKTIALVLFVFVAISSGQINIPATASWQVDPNAAQYHIFIWEGNDINVNPLFEDSSYAYVLSLGLMQFTTTDSQVVFQTQVNGNYIMACGFNENNAGYTAGATLSDLVLKPSQPNKMQFLNLSFEGEAWYSAIMDSTYLEVRNPDGSMPRHTNGIYKYWKLDEDGKMTPVTKFRE